MASENESDSSQSFYGPLPAPIFVQRPPRTPRANDFLPATEPSSGPAQSTPITGTAAEQEALRRKKGGKKRAATIQKKRKTQEEEEEELKQAEMDYIVEYMDEHNISLWDFMAYMFNPEHGQGRSRHHKFFSTRGRITQLLNWWISSKNRSQRARKELGNWAQNYVQNEVAREARKVTNSRRLQTMRRNLDAGLITSFTFPEIYEFLKNELAPVSIGILEALSTSTKARLHSKRRQERTRMVHFTFD